MLILQFPAGIDAAQLAINEWAMQKTEGYHRPDLIGLIDVAGLIFLQAIHSTSTSAADQTRCAPQ